MIRCLYLAIIPMLICSPVACDKFGQSKDEETKKSTEEGTETQSPGPGENLGSEYGTPPEADDKLKKAGTPERESNDSYLNADRIALPYKGYGATNATDADWYEFTLEKDADIVIEWFKVAGKTPDVKLYLHDWELLEIHFSPSERPLKKHLVAGTYYVRIVVYYEAEGNYGLSVKADGIKQKPVQPAKKVKRPCPDNAERWGRAPPDGYMTICRRIAPPPKYHGPMVEYYENGQRKLYSEYIEGRRELEIYYWDDGSKKEVCDYSGVGFECQKCKSEHTPDEKPCD